MKNQNSEKLQKICNLRRNQTEVVIVEMKKSLIGTGVAEIGIRFRHGGREKRRLSRVKRSLRGFLSVWCRVGEVFGEHGGDRSCRRRNSVQFWSLEKKSLVGSSPSLEKKERKKGSWAGLVKKRVEFDKSPWWRL